MANQFGDEKLRAGIQAAADRMNLDEERVPAYTLPPVAREGVATGPAFQSIQRQRLLKLFEDNMYGRIPPRCESLLFVTTANDTGAFGGLATRREISIVCRHAGIERTLRMLLYIPNAATGPVPAFFGLNFQGNHACTTDSGATFYPFERFPTMNTVRYEDNRADESGRGKQAHRWDFEKVLSHGFASATICYYDMYPDRPDGFDRSIMPMFYTRSQWESPERDSGSISAWAWGIQRALDCLEAQPEIDCRRISVHGHSRLGKTALWAGANDQRIALTVSNCSGTAGAKMHHRYYGENFEWIAVWNKHWMRPAFVSWVGRELASGFDQHQLMALVAPRLLYVASATEDKYADPKGEFASALAASEAYRLLGGEGLPDEARQPGFTPQPGNLIAGDIAYYLRAGKHDFTPENWDALLSFAESRLNP